MKFITATDDLKKAASRLQGTVSDRSLSEVGIQASQNLITLKASDRVLSMYSSFEAEVLDPGTIFVPGKLFLDVTKELPNGKVSLEINDHHLDLKTEGNARFHMRIPLVRDCQWHEPPQLCGGNEINIEASALAYVVNQVQFCISLDSPRPFGTVALLHKPQADRIRLVGTDGFRLSFSDLVLDPQEIEHFLPEGICLSKRALTELSKLCQESAGSKLQLIVDQQHGTLLIATKHCRMFIQLSKVRFPNYLGVLPTANLNLVKLSRPQLQEMMRRVMLAADKSRALQLSFCDSSLTLRSKTMGSSEGEESIKIEDYKGLQRDLSVNGRYLAEVFSATAGERITLQFKTPEDPIVIVPEEEWPSCKSLHVLVPIRENI